MMTTTEGNTELFIETVRGYPIIYDLKNKDYKNLRKKDKIWDSIGPEFKMDGDAAKKKWKNLRDTYAKYLKSMKTTTGQAAKKNYGNWQWAEQMNFLKPHLTLAKTIHNMNSPSENDSNDPISTQNVAVDNTYNESELDTEPVTQSSVSHIEIIAAQNLPISNTPSAAKRSFGSGSNMQQHKKKDTPVNQVLQYFEKKSQKRSQTQMDDLEHIFMGYAKSVKKLSRRRQTIIKIKLAEIIAEQELAEIDENTPPYNSSSTPNFSDCGNYSNTSNTSCSANNLQPIIDSNTEMTSPAATTTLTFSNYAEYSNAPSTSSANILQPIIHNNNIPETSIAAATVTTTADVASTTVEYYNNFSL